MRLTLRDARVVRDVALSHVLSRDQLIDLGYFTSVTRANSRLRDLKTAGFLRRIETPFFGQGLYVAGSKAALVAGDPVGRLLSNRTGSPRFLQHALAVTSVRIELLRGGCSGWRFEQQLWSSFEFAGKAYEIRPDGMAIREARLTLIEVDLGHVAPTKFRDKLRALDAFIRSGMCSKLWRQDSFDVLTLTTGPRRAAHLRRLLPPGASFTLTTSTFDQFGLQTIGSWS